MEIFRIFGRFDGVKVFNSDTESVFLVVSGFNRCYHTGSERRTVFCVDGNSCRAFVDVGEETDAMSGAVFIIQSLFQQRLAGNQIQLAAGSLLRKDGGGQGDVRF